MGAGRQRWWRDFNQEAAMWTGFEEWDRWGLVSAVTETGIHIKVTLWTSQPMWYGTFRVDP